MYALSIVSRRGRGHLVALDLLRVVCRVRAVVIERKNRALVLRGAFEGYLA